jgi:hypothetical protein
VTADDFSDGSAFARGSAPQLIGDCFLERRRVEVFMKVLDGIKDHCDRHTVQSSRLKESSGKANSGAGLGGRQPVLAPVLFTSIFRRSSRA